VTRIKIKSSISSMGDNLSIWVAIAMHEMVNELKRRENLMTTVEDEDIKKEK
jgi:hypothetical protein